MALRLVADPSYPVPMFGALDAAGITNADDSYPVLLVSVDDSTEPSRLAWTNGEGGLPANLVAPPMLQPLLSRMWRQSQTFRRQCARIHAEPRLLVRVYAGASYSQSGDQARTHVQRGGAGLEASVYFASHAGAIDLIELIAHEFEHIIEQLDGLDLPRLARLAPATVWMTGDRLFETKRATRTGRLVAAEVDGAPTR